MTRTIWIGDLAVPAGSDPLASPVRSSHAPLFPGDAYPRQNLCQSSDSDWEAFCRATDLTELFFSPDEGLMAARPGVARLTRDHDRALRAAVAHYVSAHRHAEPTYASGRVEDGHLARLLWLDWWVHSARRRLQEPAIHNR